MYLRKGFRNSWNNNNKYLNTNNTRYLLLLQKHIKLLMPATFIFKNLIRHVTKNKIKKDFKLLSSRKKVKSERYVSNFAFKCVF